MTFKCSFCNGKKHIKKDVSIMCLTCRKEYSLNKHQPIKELLCKKCHQFRRYGKDYCYYCYTELKGKNPRYKAFRKKVIKNHTNNWKEREPVHRQEYARNYYYSIWLDKKWMKR